jgi:hypothetical protein
MGNICGEEWAGSLGKIIGNRRNVYARYPIPHLALISPVHNFMYRIISKVSNRYLRPSSTLSKIKKDIQYL